MSDIFILGFTDELVKLAQKQRPEGYYSPKAVMKRIGSGPMGPPKPQAAGPRPAPGTRMPKPVYREKTWTPKPKPAAKKPGIPKAEGIVPGTFQRRLPDLPSGKKMPRAGGVVSEVASMKKFEAANKPKLPGWMSDEMKKPIKGHPMAKAEDVARSKKEDAEARKLVAGYTKKKPGTAVARRGVGRRKPKGMSESQWLSKRMGRKGTSPMAKWLHGKFKGTPFAPTESAIKKYRTTGKADAKVPKKKPGIIERGISSVLSGPASLAKGLSSAASSGMRSITRGMTPQATSRRPSPPWKPQKMSVPGYKAVAKKRTI